MSATKSILFRADASAAIGLGHVARCLALADELKRRGWSCTFASRVLPTALGAEIERRGFTRLDLQEDLPLASEPAELLHGGSHANVVLTDHYAIERAWHDEAAARGVFVAAIDDLAERMLGARLIVNQNLGYEVEEYRRLARSGTRVLVGPTYALVREEFRELRRAAQVRRQVRRLLVFMSGGDAHNVTGVAMRAAARLGLPVDVVVGAGFPHAQALEIGAAGLPNVAIHTNTDRMAELMAVADLAIGAPSSASWERCCLGLPAILVLLAKNQARVGPALNVMGAGWLLGWQHETTEAQLAAAIGELAADPARIERMSRAAFAVTDGLGVRRVADALQDALGEGAERQA